MIEEQGHRCSVEIFDDEANTAALRFRTRGHDVSLMVGERDPSFFAVSIAFELPEWARNLEQNAELLIELQGSLKAVKYFFTPEGDGFVAAVEQFSSTPEEFAHNLWRIVGVAREAGIAALDRILDTSESKAAADKFISDFMRGQP